MQRTALVKYHEYELRLVDGEGDWELREIHAQRKAGGGASASGSSSAGGGGRSNAPRIEELPAVADEAEAVAVEEN